MRSARASGVAGAVVLCGVLLGSASCGGGADDPGVGVDEVAPVGSAPTSTSSAGETVATAASGATTTSAPVPSAGPDATASPGSTSSPDTAAPPTAPTIALPAPGTRSYSTAGETRISGLLQSRSALPSTTVLNVTDAGNGGLALDRDLRQANGDGPRLITTVTDVDGGLGLRSLAVSVTALGTTDTRTFEPDEPVIWFPDAPAPGTNRFELRGSGSRATVDQAFTVAADGSRTMQLDVRFDGEITGTMRVTATFPAGDAVQASEHVEADVNVAGIRYEIDYDAERVN